MEIPIKITRNHGHRFTITWNSHALLCGFVSAGFESQRIWVDINSCVWRCSHWLVNINRSKRKPDTCALYPTSGERPAQIIFMNQFLFAVRLTIRPDWLGAADRIIAAGAANIPVLPMTGQFHLYPQTWLRGARTARKKLTMFVKETLGSI